MGCDVINGALLNMLVIILHVNVFKAFFVRVFNVIVMLYQI